MFLKKSPSIILLTIGISISAFGSQMSDLALSIFAINILLSTPIQMSYLRACETLPYLIFGLYVGVWMENKSLRNILICTDLMRSVVMFVTAFLLLYGVLHIELLYVAAFMSTTCTLLFDNAYYSFVPRISSNETTVRANSQLETGRQAASIFGSSVSGYLIQVFGGPGVLLINSVTYILSAFFLKKIQQNEKIHQLRFHSNIIINIMHGFKLVFANSILVMLMISGGMWNFFVSGSIAMFVIYAEKILQFTPLYIAIILATQSIGAVGGAYMSKYIPAWFGFGNSIFMGYLLASVGNLAIASCYGDFGFFAALVGSFCFGAGGLQAAVLQLSARQSSVPLEDHSRVNATMRFVFWGIMPIGAFSAGLFADEFGLRASMIAASGGLFSTAVFIFASPIGRLKAQPMLL